MSNKAQLAGLSCGDFPWKLHLKFTVTYIYGRLLPVAFHNAINDLDEVL